MALTDMNIESKILQVMTDVARDLGLPLSQNMNRGTPVFDTGLDSLGFAVLVARLEQDLGFDPFVSMSTPRYPTNLGEFIDMYSNHHS